METMSFDGNDRTTLGSYIPNFTYGINLGLNYKNLDFQLTTYGQAGAQMFNRKRALRYSTQNYNFDRAQYKNRWTGPGSTNSDPSAAALLSLWNVSDQKYSSYFVESADYFRIQNVTLGTHSATSNWATTPCGLASQPDRRPSVHHLQGQRIHSRVVRQPRVGIQKYIL